MMPMPSTLSRIFGWAPPSDESFVDVGFLGLPSPHQLPAFHISDHALMEPSSPASSTSALSDDQSERRQEGTGRKGDPNWIARPRNEFILFRCDYVRKHTKEGGNKRSRRTPGQEAEKTLSKLAAEAWRALSSEERLYWREQANLERNDHARKYPDYRYRPKKSATARKRQSRSSMSSSVVTRSMPAPAIVDRVTVDSNSRSPSYDPPMPMVEHPTLYLDNSLRKSTSVPLLPSNRRQSDWMSLSLQPIQNSFDSRVNTTGINTYHQAIHHYSQSYESIGLATPALSESMSIPDSTSSSLINWNGEPILAPQPTQFIDPVLLPHSNFGSDSPGLGSQKFLNAVSGGQPSHVQLIPNGPPPQFQQPNEPNGARWVPDVINMLRTSSAGEQENLPPFMGGPRDGHTMYDSMGRVGLQSHRDEFHIPPGANVGVVPGEYLTSSAGMTPDVFIMDREEYFTSY